MFNSLLNLLFRCAHKRMTRPMTPARKSGEPVVDPYVICLDCGKQFLYDMKEMRIGKPVAVSPVGKLLQESMPSSKARRFRYIALASAVPIALIGAHFTWFRRRTDACKGYKSNGASKLDQR